jgi:RND family efflux transporter MFP subunit
MSTASQRLLAVLALIGCGVCLVAGCGRSGSDHTTAERLQPVSVSLAVATVVERAEPMEAGGVVTADQTATVSSRVTAPVVQVTVRAGDRVRSGDVLVRLEASEMTARRVQANAATRAAEEALAAARSGQTASAAEQKLAAAWHARISQLRERNAATAQEFDEAEARLTAAAARATSAQAGVEQAAAQLASLRAGADVAAVTEAYAVLRAPFDGVITERLIDPGNLATPGQALLRIDGGGRRRVELHADEARAAFIHPGDRAAVALDGDNPIGGTVLEGNVVEVARAIAADQRTFTVKVTLPPDAAPRTGTFARVRFDGPRRRVLIVPSTAVRSQGQVQSVFVVSGGTAHLRLVQTGDPAADGTEIIAGLDAGESVVTNPPATLTDGRTVTTGASPPPGAP